MHRHKAPFTLQISCSICDEVPQSDNASRRNDSTVNEFLMSCCCAFPRCRSKVSNALATPGREQERFTVTPKGGTDSSKIYRFLSSFI